MKSSLVPLVVFGDDMKNKDAVKIKKRLAGVTSKLYKDLICRQKQHLATVVDIDEFRTSITCNMCNSGAKMLPMKLPDGKKGNGILESKNPCNILWQRGINAAKNMLGISNSIWQGKGRPDPFKRKIAVAETASIV